MKVGTGVKSEGELIVSGTKGYVYIPAPWWKTDYFEVRYGNAEDNRRYFFTSWMAKAFATPLPHF